MPESLSGKLMINDDDNICLNASKIKNEKNSTDNINYQLN